MTRARSKSASSDGVHVAHHDLEERVERDDLHSKLIFIRLFHLGELEGVDAVGGAEGEVDVGALNSICQLTVFVFWVDHDNLGVEKGATGGSRA